MNEDYPKKTDYLKILMDRWENDIITYEEARRLLEPLVDMTCPIRLIPTGRIVYV